MWHTVLWGSTWALALCNPLCHHVIPLLQRLAPEQSDDNNGHVVAPDTAGLAAWRQTIVHHILADLLKSLFSGNTSADELDNSL